MVQYGIYAEYIAAIQFYTFIRKTEKGKNIWKMNRKVSHQQQN